MKSDADREESSSFIRLMLKGRGTQMKKIICLLFALIVLTASCASAQVQLRDIHALCEKEYPGYEIAVQTGGADRIAMVLQNGEDNVLCIAEWDDAQGEYVMTLSNTRAVHDGEMLPGLMFDTDGETLFITYDDGYHSVHYDSVLRDGEWGSVGSVAYASDGEESFSSWTCAVYDGALHYTWYREDENGNVLDTVTKPPVPVSGAFAEGMKLAQFDIEAYDPDPSYGLNMVREKDGFAHGLVAPGETVLCADLQAEHLLLLIEKEDGARCLRDAVYHNEEYSVRDSGVLPPQAGMDAYHTGDGELYLYGYGQEAEYIFGLAPDGRWLLEQIWDEGSMRVTPFAVCDLNEATVMRNDGYIYGEHVWQDVMSIDFAALPRSFEQAAREIDQQNFALVVNPNPEDRLHLRERADRGSKSLGKFFNRTPVRVLERGETWTKVRIGTVANLTGYMMTKYLAFTEEEKAAVACAFPQKHFSSEYYVENGLRLLAQPDPGGEYNGLYFHRDGDMIIGVYGDEYYIVLRSDGSIGYVIQIAFWDGNG